MTDLFARRLAVVLAAGIAIAILVLGAQVFLIAFGGVLLAVFLLSVAAFISRYTPLSHKWALALAILVLLGALATAVVTLAPLAVEQATEFRDQLPKITERLRQYAVGRWVLDWLEGGESSGAVATVAKAALDNLSHIATGLLTVLFIGIFGALDPERYKAGIVNLFPLRLRARAAEVLGEIGQTLRWWLIGRAIGMTLVGVSMIAVLSLMGMSFAVLLGIVAGVLEFVPYFGPILAGVPIVVLALLESPQTALYIIGAYFVVQTIESYLLEPLIMQRTVLVPPAFTLFMQVLMGTLFGVLGIVMATPVAAVLHVLNRTVYRQDVLGEKRARD